MLLCPRETFLVPLVPLMLFLHCLRFEVRLWRRPPVVVLVQREQLVPLDELFWFLLWMLYASAVQYVYCTGRRGKKGKRFSNDEKRWNFGERSEPMIYAFGLNFGRIVPQCEQAALLVVVVVVVRCYS